MDDINQNDTIETGHVRVVLLVLAVCAFSWVWQNDHPPEPPEQRIDVSFQIDLPPISRSNDFQWATESCWNITPWTPVKQDLAPLAILEIAQPEEPVEAELIAIVAEKPTQIETQEFSFPLPKAIVPGDYRVLDQQGQLSQLTITLEMMLAHDLRFGSSHAESFVSRQGDNRWHFIRLEQAHSAPTTQEIVVEQKVKAVWHGLFDVLDREIERPLRTLNRPLKRWLSPQIELANEAQLLK